MGLFSEVKCGRCDRRYSGLRARCPYCGARRGKRGKHAHDDDNSKGRLIIGLILVIVLIAAVVVVVATSITNAPANDADANDQQTQQGGAIGDSDGVTNVEGAGAGTYDTTQDDTGSTEPDGDDVTGDDTTGDDVSGVATAVNDLYIVSPWSNSPQADFTANVGDVIDFDYVTDPVLEDAEVLWETSDDNIFVILQTGEFTAIGEGIATLKLTVNGAVEELTVHVR